MYLLRGAIFSLRRVMFTESLTLFFKSFRFRPEWFEVFYQLELNGKVIASGESFGWGETKEFTVPGSEEIIRG